MKRQRPRGLGPAGRKLYDEVLGNVASDWELDSKDFGVLDRACKLADRAARLERELGSAALLVPGSRGQDTVHPAVAELRAHDIAIAALVRQIEISPPTKRTWNNKGAEQLRDARRARWSR